MSEEIINQEFRLKKIDEIGNYLIEEIKQNKLMGKNSNYLSIPIEITSSAIGLNVCAITAGIKKYKSIIKKKKKKHDRIVLLAKSKLNSI